MRIIFVLTCPVYQRIDDLSEWLAMDNRNRRMPAIVATMGADVELWAVGREEHSLMSDLPGIAPYPIRIFAASGGGAKSRDAYSDAMVDAARGDPADLFVLIGATGSAGYRLYDKVLKPGKRRFAVILNGEYWSRIVPHAAFLFSESARQEQVLSHPGWRFWRRHISPHHMQRLAKAVDTDRFRPEPDLPKQWDIITISRLNRWKRFDEIGALSTTYRVAVIGDGPQASALATRYPHVTWLGHIRHEGVPALLNRARLYFHAGRRDDFPLGIAEAMACGLPVVAMEGRIGFDVVPTGCGALVNDSVYPAMVDRLLADERHRAAMGRSARAHVLETNGPDSSIDACRTLVTLAQ
ncbi:hypothetical protein GCM10023219_08460 [Stakelama sediminis]|uniref:Glycosyltransferase involved in cell wall biosynthesis n=1 Tax=Stakelama sediminis TaxID=463200 RepID=A0A840YVJ5_9SPHN|nr:glycosyltransferase [Stakelama sediminis]MBB5717569.1 glycosyltransferase involved in cell wall biosynthesis [Stakelama sediminis]